MLAECHRCNFRRLTLEKTGGEEQMTTAVVVGSGPNGLAAAIELARAGIDVHVIEGADKIGGGTRSSEYIVDGLVHDDCSAFHPTALASPYFKELDREFGLAKHGLTWLWPEIDLVHPLDDGTAGVLWRDINRTADGLGADGKRWLDVFGYLSENFDELVQDVFQPIVHVPKHPLMLARFGTGALLPATGFARMFKTPQARALFGGVAAHMFGTLTLPLSSAVGSMLTAAAHAHGWPVAQGGSGSIAAALASILRSLGGTIETGNWVTNYSQIAGYDIVMLDIAPDAAGRLLEGRQPDRIARAYRKFRYGTAAYKVDYAVRGDSDGSVVPWTNPHARKAGTLHLSGTISQTAAVERQTVRGQMPDKPFILLGQQFLADPSRSVGDIHPCGRMRMYRMAIRVTPPMRSRVRSSALRRGSGTGSWASTCAMCRRCSVQPQLCGRRHLRGGEHCAADHRAPPVRARPLCHWG